MNKLVLLSLLLLAACGDPALSRNENATLREIRAQFREDAEARSSTLYPVLSGNPEKLAEQAAHKGDFRLIGLAIGYHATKEHAFAFGVECTAPVEMKTAVLGCMPPPPVVFRQVMRYNVALIRQPGFPKDKVCKPDGRAEESVNQMSAELEESAKKRPRKDREQEPELYNP